jgi:hypothetical protein
MFLRSFIALSPASVLSVLRMSLQQSWGGPSRIDCLVNKFNGNLTRLIEGEPLIGVLTVR